MPVKDHRTPGSHTMNSSSTNAPGMWTRRRAPTPVAGPITSTLRTFGNHSGQRTWSASTANTASGGAEDTACPMADTGARSIQSMACWSMARTATTLLSPHAAVARLGVRLVVLRVEADLSSQVLAAR